MVYYDYDNHYWVCDGKIFHSFDEAHQEAVKAKSGRRFYNEVDGEWYRSRWEIVTANSLYDSAILFDYEPKRFLFSRKHKESYLPDYYLPEFNCWVEVKGYWDKRSIKRVKLFREEYPNEKLVIVEAKEIERLKANPRSIIWILYEQGVSIDEVF